MLAMTLAETTPENTRTDPSDRSSPPLTSTNVKPTASTSRVEALIPMFRRFGMVRKAESTTVMIAPSTTTTISSIPVEPTNARK